MELETLEFEG